MTQDHIRNSKVKEKMRSAGIKRGFRPWVFLISVFTSLALVLTFYLLFIQSPLLSKRELAFTGLAWLLFIPLVYLCLVNFVIPRLKRLSSRGSFILLLLSFLFGLLIITTTNHPQLYLLFPKHSLIIVVPDISNTQTGERIVKVTGFTNEYGDVSFSQFQQTGTWQRGPNSISHYGPSPASLQWEGRLGSSAQIEFENIPNAGQVLVSWDGQPKTINLQGSSGGTATISESFPDDIQGRFFSDILIWFTSSFLFLVITLFLLSAQIRKRGLIPKPGFSWLSYTLPMIIVWGIYMFTFFPGMMSNDSIIQWSQVVSGQFNDAHPVFHTLMIWLITRFWYSPAGVVIFQILTLSLTVAWGIRILDQEGIPTWSSWSLVAIFALSPLNGYMVTTLWKDVPYSTSLFLFSLMVLKIVLTNGSWLDKKMTWVWLGLVSLCVASFRHNGPPIPLLTLLILILVYRLKWKSLLGALVLFVVLYTTIHGPVYSILRVNRNIGYKQLTFVHHIAAHIIEGGPLSPEEEAMAIKILPLDEWKYSCCKNVDVFLAQSYSDENFSRNVGTIQKLFLTLALKEPNIELNHLICISSTVWEIPSRCGQNTFLPINESTWISPVNKFFTENSLLPSMRNILSGILIEFRTNLDLTVFIAPALYLYLGVYIIFILARRKRNFKLILFMVPSLIQSIVLSIASTSTEFRYQYGVYLVGLFSVGLLILAMCTPNEIDVKAD